MAMDWGKIEQGMVVVGVDGESIGKVKALLGQDYIHVDCPRAPDYYVPASAVKGLSEGRLMLCVTRNQAAYMGWELKPGS